MRKKKPTTAAQKRYEIGYGCPPKQFQFKRGQSGNPAGKNRKTPSNAPDLRALVERALNTKIKGEGQQIVTKADAGINKLVNQFAEGDPRARRDLIAIAERLGIDLTASQGKHIENAIAEAVSAQDEALLSEYVQHQIEMRFSGGESNLPRPQFSSEVAPTNPPKEGESK